MSRSGGGGRGADRSARYLACLAELSSQLREAAEPLSLLVYAAESLREASEADRCWILETSAPGVAFARLQADVCAPEVTPLGRLETASLDSSLLGSAELARGEPLAGPVAELPPRPRAALEAQGVRDFAIAPIAVGGAAWGLLGLHVCRAGRPLDEADVALLRSAANALGAVIERAGQALELRRSEGRFRAIVDQAFDLIAELDETGTFLYASPSFEAVFAVQPERLIGTTVFERIHPEDRPGALLTYRSARPADGGRLEFRMQHEDGSWRWIEATGRFFDNIAGRRRAVIIGRDATERRSGDQQRLRLEQAMDQAGDAIVIWDREGRVVYVNAQWERMMEVPRSEALGRRIESLAALSQTDVYADEATEALHGKSTWGGRLRGGNGRIVDTSVAAVRDAKGHVQHYVSVARDVTREVELEEQIRRQQKLEAIGTLATGVAHDFNNLLTGVLGYAELLAQRHPSQEEVAEAARVIGEAARRGADLTSRLLGFGLQSRLRSEPVDVHETIGEVVRLVSRAFPRSIAILVDLCAPDHTVTGDPGQLQEVFLNLAVNARDAMPEGGELLFRTEAGGEVGGAPALAVKVRDTGTGIAPELHERIFEPFFTTRQAQGGTGMGLAVVYGIVSSHRGEIELESRPGGGTTFTVRLPLAESPAPARVEPASVETALGEGRVLVVDDEPAVRRVASRMLRRLGYEPDQAEDGAEALERVAADPSAYALVILDLDMPHVDGRACLRALRNLAPQLPVLVSSGLPASELADLLEGDARAVLPKPYELLQLARAVASAIRRPEPR